MHISTQIFFDKFQKFLRNSYTKNPYVWTVLGNKYFKDAFLFISQIIYFYFLYTFLHKDLNTCCIIIVLNIALFNFIRYSKGKEINTRLFRK